MTAVDIQAYSTFLCKALLEVQPEAFEHLLTDEFSARVKEFYGELIAAFGPLIEVEQAAHRLARDGSTESLAAIVEYGSLAGFAQRPPAECPKQLRAAIKSVLANVERASLQEKAVASFYYGGAYFSYAQALILDAIYLAGAQLGADTRVAALATLLSTASEVVNTVGKQFAQPIKLLKADGTTPKILLSRTLRDRSIEPLPMFMAWVEKWRQAVSSRLPVSHGTRCGDVAEFVETDQACGIYYADPPYTIDHYSRFYHVLETLVLRDEPTLDEMQKKGRSAVMRGIYRSGRYQSPFSIPSSVSSAFERLFYAVASRRAPLILSYSPFDVSEGHRPRLLSLEQLTLLARRYFSSVEVLEVNEHSHRKLNAKALNVPIKSDGERLIVCR